MHPSFMSLQLPMAHQPFPNSHCLFATYICNLLLAPMSNNPAADRCTPGNNNFLHTNRLSENYRRPFISQPSSKLPITDAATIRLYKFQQRCIVLPTTDNQSGKILLPLLAMTAPSSETEHNDDGVNYPVPPFSDVLPFCPGPTPHNWEAKVVEKLSERKDLNARGICWSNVTPPNCFLPFSADIQEGG